MEEFIIELQAKLNEAKSKENINKDIDKLQSQLDKLKLQAEIDPKTVSDLTKQLEGIIGQKIVISGIDLDQGQATKAGKKYGRLISDSAEKAVSDATSKGIGKYFKVSPSDSSQFNAEMEKLVSRWTDGKGKITDISIQTRTSYDREANENIERLHQATVTYKNELDEVIRKTIAWRQIGTTTNEKGEEVALRGFVEVAGQYSKSLDTVNAKTDSFTEKQQKAVASAQNTLATIETKLQDANTAKSLAGTDFDTNGLNTQLDRVRSAIADLDNAGRDTFTQAQIDVDREITSLNNLISTLKNAEYAATSLRTKDIATIKTDEENRLDTFVQKMEQSGHYTDELKDRVNSLRTDLLNTFDAGSLTSYLNGLSNLQSEFQKVDATAKTSEKSTKLDTNTEAEKKILQLYANELKEAGVLTDDVKEKIQHMFHALSKVDTQSGLTTWRAELKGVKAETDAVLKSAQAGSSKEQDAYEAAYKELKKLYDLRIEYAKIGSNKKTDFYFENAISKQEEAYRQARANTSTPENWDVQKRLELERQELVMQDRLEKAYGRAAEAKKGAAKAGDIGNSVDRGDYDAKFEKLKASYDKLGFTSAEVEARTNDVALALDRLKEKNLDTLVQDEKDFANALKKSQNEADILKTDLSSIYSPKKQTKLSNDIQNWLSRNKRASEEARNSLQEYYNELSNGRVSVEKLNQIEQAYKRIDTEQRGLGRIGKSLKEQFSEAGAALAQMVSISAGVMGAISKTKEAVSELKDLDDILTEISKTSDLTKQQLEDLGNNAFEAASKYGRTATDYLTGVQEMYRAGFDNAEQMAELSMLAQAAGDMESDSANDYLMATNAAYDFKGSVEELNKVLDSQNYITNNAAVSMQDMADATSEAASIAAQYGVGIDELSAMIAVVTSKTRESGSEVGTALKSIFVTLQDTTSKPVVEAFDAVGISMTKIVDGAERLKTPIELLKELSVAFNELPEGAIERANILTDIGKKYHANTLSAILSDWESYESMIDLYSQGMGSAAEEAEKSANNITGSLNRLHNTWVDTVENVANSDAIITIVNGLNSLLSVVNNVTDKLGSAGTIGVGAGLFAGLKNIGKRRMSIRIS